MNDDTIKALLSSGSTEFWSHLEARTREVSDFNDLFRLSTLRKKAHARQIPRYGLTPERFKLAIIGGYSFYPFHDLLEHFCEVERFPCELWLGSFDNYVAEVTDPASDLYAFGPQVVLVLPPEHRCQYTGRLTDPRERQQAEAVRFVDSLLDLVRKLHNQSGSEIIVSNFMLPARHDLGAYRSRTLGSDWSFRKWVNLELGLNAPSFLHICDLEFLTNRHGGIAARDERGWFASRQPCSAAMLPHLAREVAHLIGSLKRSPKKMLVLDLDNTLWGGVVADDGIEGIEIGDTSPRGEAFKAFQKYIRLLKERGVLLGVASKNDHAIAANVFQKHPEMVLHLEDFVSFKANWDPKSDNIRQMANELNLGLDSFVFVDDNPAEIEIVRQFVPEVSLIALGPDPSEYVAQLQDCRLFEPLNITVEDAERTGQYHKESQRQALFASITNMESYWNSLEMEGSISEFTSIDVPRLAQLINKSNQFNLTTRRRTEAEIQALMKEPDYCCFSFRLKDRFGDHGLISILIGRQKGLVMHIDTWLMSCRVLKRQVEEEVLNELARVAKDRGCTSLEGIYLPTAKNEMVRDFYSRMGFALTHESVDGRKFVLSLESFRPIPTKIAITRQTYE